MQTGCFLYLRSEKSVLECINDEIAMRVLFFGNNAFTRQKTFQVITCKSRYIFYY